ncbi:MAG: hypothetical protein LBK13_05850 [Spirochaetales bacterium]|jgi:hypothetical protein|nr:hypothetical protein [Spirochaetales bacterium]
MRQSGIFRLVYEGVSGALAGVGVSSGLFTVGEGAGAGEARLCVEVADLCQTAVDKSGERFIAGDVSYEWPARFGMILVVRGEAGSYPELLDALGCAARFLKDNPFVGAGGCAWHGGGECRVFIEPFVREPSAVAAVCAVSGEGRRCLCLYYRVEVALNSEVGKPFRRIQRRDLRTQVKKEG